MCSPPEHIKVGGVFDGELSLRQLRYAGLFEAIRIRKSGFAYRASFRVFANGYQILVDGLGKKRAGVAAEGGRGEGDREACGEILKEMTSRGVLETSNWVLGTSRVFLKTNMHRTLLEREKVSRVTVFALRIQAVVGLFLLRRRAIARVKALRREQRAEAVVAEEYAGAAVVLQKSWRRAAVLLLMKSMHSLIELRRVLARREVSKVKALLVEIDKQLDDGKGGGGGVAGAGGVQVQVQGVQVQGVQVQGVQREVKVARVMVRLMEIQEKLVTDVTDALKGGRVADLDRLLVKAERLEMGQNPVVMEARAELWRLSEKRRVMQAMVAFLRNEDQFTESILSTLKQAQEIGIEPTFIARVHEVYEAAGPRLKTRNRLRAVVETVDR
ncbi:P-loop containing nucleoside triphosphate hydrolase protein [Ochromonadaceae sp. CCMP2298]|nr:P-loop containing nucleoside triphosphate hydrolase protein [Ochromonadaceae sp. CCMP2298]